MPKITKPLSHKEIDKAKPKEKPYKLYDGQGLILIISKHSKNWVFEYSRPVTKKRNMLSLGSYPTISLAQARQIKDDYRKLLANNIDPSEYRKQLHIAEQQSHLNTFESIADEWLSKQVYKTNSLRSAKLYLSYANKYIGKKPIKDITAKEILSICKIYENQQKYTTAKAIKIKISQVMQYAVVNELREYNPVNNLTNVLISPNKTKKNRPALIEIDDFKKLMIDIEQCQSMNYQTKQALKLLAMLFCRSSELLAMKIEDIDFEKQQWKYTPEKTNTTTKVELITPLPTQAITIIKDIMKFNQITSGYLFITNKGKGLMAKRTLSNALNKLGYQDRHCPHGFRASAKTILEQEFEHDPRFTEMQLGHVVKDSNGTAYHRAKFIKQRKQMLQHWADYLDSLIQKHQDTHQPRTG